MNFICALSNEIANQPVVSPVSGNVFERRLILKYLQENDNRDPINGNKLQKDQLIAINLSVLKDFNGQCKKNNEFSVPELVKFLQEQWDVMILQIFHLKKQLQASAKEIEMLLNQQNDSSKIINILNSELLKCKQERKSIDYSRHSDNVYSNLPSIDNKENIFASSINSSNGSSFKGSDLLLPSNDDKSISDKFSYHLKNDHSLAHSNYTNHSSINSKFSDQLFLEGNEQFSTFKRFNELTSPKLSTLNCITNQSSSSFQKYNKLSYSTEYVNLNSSKFDRNHRTQSVIIQNDSLFDELNSMKSCEKNLSNQKQHNQFKSYTERYAEQIRSNESLKRYQDSKKGYAYNKLNDDDLYCNLKEMKEFDRISLNSKKRKIYINKL